MIIKKVMAKQTEPRNIGRISKKVKFECKLCRKFFYDYKCKHRKFCSIPCMNRAYGFFRGHDKKFYVEASKKGREAKIIKYGTLKLSEVTKNKISTSNKRAYSDPILRIEISKRQRGKSNSAYNFMLGDRNPKWK